VDGEPAAGPWRVERLTHFAQLLVNAGGASIGRPPIVALDGRSSSGKTTLAHRLEQAVPGAVTVHTDDIAWWHSFFGWADLLASGVLEPLRRARAVAFRPPAWDTRGRPGAIEVPADAGLVIVEGVGASRREIAHLLDAAVWVQSELGAIERRNAARVAAGETNASLVARWMAEEFPFVADQRPWERALVCVAGTPELPHDPSTEVVLAPTPLPG
jgi:chloramphenicol 3-O-phosphotransferase